MPNSNEVIVQLLDELAESECSCDLLVGWVCSIHHKIREIKEQIDKSAVKGV